MKHKVSHEGRTVLLTIDGHSYKLSPETARSIETSLSAHASMVLQEEAPDRCFKDIVTLTGEQLKAQHKESYPRAHEYAKNMPGRDCLFIVCKDTGLFMREYVEGLYVGITEDHESDPMNFDNAVVWIWDKVHAEFNGDKPKKKTDDELATPEQERALKYIRDSYQVPAKFNGRIRYNGGSNPREGTIKDGKHGRLSVLFDDAKEGSDLAGLHPTWEIEYL